MRRCKVHTFETDSNSCILFGISYKKIDGIHFLPMFGQLSNLRHIGGIINRTGVAGAVL